MYRHKVDHDPPEPPSWQPISSYRLLGMPTAVVLTALSCECSAVLDHLDERREEWGSAGTLYEVGQFGDWRVAVAEIGPGNENAAVETDRALGHYRPDVALFIGVAGGLKDVNLGDVVVATKIYGYEYGKAERRFLPRPEVGQSSHRLVQRARGDARRDSWLHRLPGPGAKPRVLVQPIAAGAKVVTSERSATRAFLREQYGDAVAVEMEGFGFLKAAFARSDTQAVVVRGISDLIEGKAAADQGGSQERASQHAAAFAFEMLANLSSTLSGEDPSPPGQAAVKADSTPLDGWFSQVADDHRRLADHFERPVELYDLERAWVRLELSLDEATRIAEKDLSTRTTLDDFLALEATEHSWVTRRWLVEGDPGSGKTTLLRHLAGRLAKEGNPGRIPVFVSLPRLVEPLRNLLDYLSEEIAPLLSEKLPEVLDEAGREGRLLVLLDGYDEVLPERRQRARQLLSKLDRDWPESLLVVASRPIGLGEPPLGFRKLLLQPLDEKQRLSFLEKWFRSRATTDPKAEASDAARHFDGERGLRELSHNPLHLTLLTVLWEKGVKAPTRRSALYDEIFELLLHGRHKDPPVAIRATEDVHLALRHLAHALTLHDLAAEEPGRLEQRLREPELEALRRRLDTVWDKNLRAFLDEVHERTYILGPHDGPRSGWRFWHRTFREALTAEHLAEVHRVEGEAAVLAQVETIEGDLGRWAEPYSLLAGRLDDADYLVTRLVEKNRPLGLRALATAQGLKPETLQTVLGLTDDWEERRKVFESIPEQLDEPESCLALIDGLRTRKRDGNDLFFLHSAASVVTKRWPAYSGRVRELHGRFFDHIPAPGDSDLFRKIYTPLDALVELWREIPVGEGWIGSLESEADEVRHRIEIARPFWLGAVPITNVQYAVFDPGRAPQEWDGVSDAELSLHPRVLVTWYEAMSFCRWLAVQVPGYAGARLPTEEEWEYACRAGSETAYWKGDSEEALAEVGWYDKNSGYRTHRVGEKPKNPWGLYDVHGNVWEWTASVWDAEKYEKRLQDRPFAIDPAAQPADLAAPPGVRVIRGGCCWVSADGTRAAARSSGGSGIVLGLQGFRVLLPFAPS